MPRQRLRRRPCRLLLFPLVIVALLLPVDGVRADRASENMDPGWMFEKKEVWDKAAMYWQRGLLGLNRVYIAFHWNGDPAANAAGKYASEYVEIPKSFEAHYQTCLANAKLTPQGVARMEAINDLWLSELIEMEGGGLRTACMHLAPEAERHGDFRLAEMMRRGEARYYRVVVLPYHRDRAAACRKAGNASEALLHEARVQSAEKRADFADRLAKGNDVLRRVEGFGGIRYYVNAAFYPQKVNPVSFQNIVPERLWKRKTGEWIGPKPEEVAAMLKTTGLTHADENVRLTSVNVLAHLGEKEAVRQALGDASPLVRLTAAEALARTRWAAGWAACAAHADPDVRAAVAPLLTPVGKDPLERTWVIGELIDGLNVAEPMTVRFCEASLEKVAGTKQPADGWADWWRRLGDARPGLTRTAPDGKPAVDETIDFGTWWQCFFWHAPNPLLDYAPPVKVAWTGSLVVPETGTYRFFVRNVGEKRSGANMVVTPGRGGFPGMYLSRPAATLTVDGKAVLPHGDDCVQDPNCGIRLDFSESLRLEKGLHAVRLEFDYRSRREDNVAPEPCVRLYWESERFLRQVVPATALVTVRADAKTEAGH